MFESKLIFSNLLQGVMIKMDVQASILLLIFVLIAGCASSGTSQFAGTSYIEKIGPGEIRYLNEGASFTRKARREDVYKKIAESCNGDFKILKEGVKSRTGTIQTQESIDDYPNASYVYIKYACVM